MSFIPRKKSLEGVPSGDPQMQNPTLENEKKTHITHSQTHACLLTSLYISASKCKETNKSHAKQERSKTLCNHQH